MASWTHGGRWYSTKSTSTKKRKSGPDLAARFAKISEAIETETEKALFAIGVKIKDAAARSAPRKSGKLAAGYAVRMRYRNKTPIAVVGTLVPYATYVEFAKDIGGHEYGKNLPEPARVLYKALDDNVNEITQMIADAIGRGLGRIEGA